MRQWLQRSQFGATDAFGDPSCWATDAFGDPSCGATDVFGDPRFWATDTFSDPTITSFSDVFDFLKLYLKIFLLTLGIIAQQGKSFNIWKVFWTWQGPFKLLYTVQLYTQTDGYCSLLPGV